MYFFVYHDALELTLSLAFLTVVVHTAEMETGDH